MSAVGRLTVLVIGLWLVAVSPNGALAFNDVTAGSGGIAAGGNITGNNINFGLTPEQLNEMIEAAVRGATGPLTAKNVDLSKQLGVSEDVTNTLLRILGEQDVPWERRTETLYRAAMDYKRLQAQGGSPKSGQSACPATGHAG